jgi:RNA 2',3'-cyclic 3'-phosphodiesterase
VTRRGNGSHGRSTRPDDDHAERPHLRRVFVAIPLPEPAGAEITTLVENVRAAADPTVRDVRWVRLDGLHLTLRFIGPADDAAIEGIGAAVDDAATGLEPFDAAIEGAGAFPTTGRPRVIWLGIGRGDAELTAAAEAVEDRLATIGIPRSERPFRAHLTLARADGIRSGPDVARRLIAASEGRRTEFRATELVLYETIAGGGPARYVRLRTAVFGRRPSSIPEPRRSAPGSVLPSVPSAGDGTSVGARRKEQSSGT